MPYQRLRDALFKGEGIRSQQLGERNQNTPQDSNERQPAVNSATFDKRRNPANNNTQNKLQQQIKCHRCYEKTHIKPDCPLNGTDLWFCGGCNTITNHIRKDCEWPTQQTIDNQNRSVNLENQNNERQNTEYKGGQNKRGGGKMSNRGKYSPGNRGKPNQRGGHPKADVEGEISKINNSDNSD